MHENHGSSIYSNHSEKRRIFSKENLENNNNIQRIKKREFLKKHDQKTEFKKKK